MGSLLSLGKFSWRKPLVSELKPELRGKPLVKGGGERIFQVQSVHRPEKASFILGNERCVLGCKLRVSERGEQACGGGDGRGPLSESMLHSTGFKAGLPVHHEWTPQFPSQIQA